MSTRPKGPEKQHPAVKRLFMAIWPDSASLEALQQIQQRQVKPEIGRSSIARLVNPAKLHLTLLFLGNIPENKEVRFLGKLSETVFDSFRIVFDEILFRKKQKMVWLGMSRENESLVRLVDKLKQCAQESGIETESRKFIGHLTLARKVGHFDSVGPLAKTVSWQVSEMALVESRTYQLGAEYRVLFRKGLGEI